MSDIEVSVEQLRQHAKSVQSIGDGMAEAATAGTHVAALDDAYGWICQSMGLPEMLRAPQERGAQSIADITHRLREDATDLTASADTYQQVEERLAELMRKLVEALDRAAKAPKVGGR
jgi:uncharacterized protein YukE